MKKISNNLIFIREQKPFLVSFAGTALEKKQKLEKFGPALSSFNPYPSLSSVATDGRKQLNNKGVPLFFVFN